MNQGVVKNTASLLLVSAFTFILISAFTTLIPVEALGEDCFTLPNVPVIFVDPSYSDHKPDGTSKAPFQRVTDAYKSAVDCSIIKITSGSYSEAITLSKHIQLQGQGGVVTIGAMSGTFYGNDNAVYYIQRSGNDLWWAGESVDAGKTPLQVWHRGLDYSSVFHGTVVGNTVAGEWVDVCRGVSVATGSLTARIDTTVLANGTISNHLALTGGSYHATDWSQGGPVNDFLYQYPDGHKAPMDFYQRFRSVHKNDNPWFNTQPYPETALGDTHNPQNLRPYRDQTVFYGELTTRNPEDDETPHVNYKSLRPTDFHSFVCFDDGDGDLDLRLHVFVNSFRSASDFPSLPTDFPGVGWGNANVNDENESGDDSRDLIHKFLHLGLFDPGAAEHLNLAGFTDSTKAYLGAEGIMYGGNGGKTGDQVTTDCDTTTVDRLFPGWADTGGNSILVNGRPINGVPASPPDAEVDSQHTKRVLLRKLLGHELHPFDSKDPAPPTELRVTGALVLDCGHQELNNPNTEYTAPSGAIHDCLQNSGWDARAPAENQNQEIHPFYALDIIETDAPHNLGWDPTKIARSDLTGAWGSSDGGTYYIRHIGSTIWWLGLTRNRAPIIPPSAMTCACQKIPDPANVFQGTISMNPKGSATITGQAVVVPKGLNTGGASTTATFTLESNRKVLHLVSTTSPFPFPSRFDKLWEP